jgi:ParB-like chromosome segregation protein Spo0J
VKVHEHADLFPMLPEDELETLAADIKKHGLIHPIVVDDNDQIVDGRNRLAACKIAGVKPTFEKLNGRDADSFIVSANLARRNLTKGQQAAVYATIYPEGEKGGRGKKGKASESDGFSATRVKQARAVLKHSRELLKEVISGTKSLDDALEIVQSAGKESSLTEEKIARLKKDAPDLAARLKDAKANDQEGLSVDEATAILDVREREQKEQEEATTDLVRKVLILLSPGEVPPAKHGEHLAGTLNRSMWGRSEPVALNSETIDAALEVFKSFAKGWKAHEKAKKN